MRRIFAILMFTSALFAQDSYTYRLDADNRATGKISYTILKNGTSTVKTVVDEAIATTATDPQMYDQMNANVLASTPLPAITPAWFKTYIIDGKANAVHTHAWGDLTSGVPATFPPSAHSHPESDVTNLVSDLAGKSATGHTHVKANITDFSHTHPESDVVNLTTDLAAKEVALTFSTGLTRSTNTITVNSSQSIATLSNLTTNGFVKTGGGVGTLSVDTTAYVPTTRNVSTSAPLGGGGALSSDLTLTCATCVTTTRTISTTAPLGGGGDLSANRTLTCTTCTTTIASGTSTFSTTAISSGACSSTVTTAATGAATTDRVAWAYSTSVGTADGRLTVNVWLTSGNVNWNRCNTTAASITPTAMVVNWMVLR